MKLSAASRSRVSSVLAAQDSSAPLRVVRLAFLNVLRPPAAVSTTISFFVSMWYTAKVRRWPPGRKAFTPSSVLTLVLGRSAKLSPGTLLF